MYLVRFSKTSYKNFKKLDKRYQKFLGKAIDRLGTNPQLGTPLKGKLKGLWKIRFSRYRIIYQIKRRYLIVIILDIRHRKDIYKS